jgi:hypothetical protein
MIEFQKNSRFLFCGNPLQGCQMVYFHTKCTNFEMPWDRKVTVIGTFMAIWWLFWYIFSTLVCCAKKNLATKRHILSFTQKGKL